MLFLSFNFFVLNLLLACKSILLNDIQQFTSLTIAVIHKFSALIGIFDFSHTVRNSLKITSLSLIEILLLNMNTVDSGVDISSTQVILWVSEIVWTNSPLHLGRLANRYIFRGYFFVLGLIFSSVDLAHFHSIHCLVFLNVD